MFPTSPNSTLPRPFPRTALCPLLLAIAGACGGGSSYEPPSDIDGGTAATADAAPTPTPDAAPGSEADYPRMFPLDHVAEVRIDFQNDGWETILATPLDDIYVPADLTYDGVAVANVGVRIKGNSSRWQVADSNGIRYSLKVDLDRYVPGQSLFGVDKFNLNNGFNDPTQLREIISRELFAAAGIPTPQMGFVQLTINGQLHGTYVVVEQVDREFLRRHFAADTGDLYKPEAPAGHLGWLGADITAYDGMELKTNETTSDHSAMLHFLDVLNNTPDAELATELPKVLEVDLFLRYLALSALHVNLDSILGPGHNYYLYQDPTDGRFVLIPWDLNGTFAVFNCGMSPPQLVRLSFEQPHCVPRDRRVLVDRVLAVPEFRSTYESYLAEFSAADTGPFTLERVTNRVYELAEVLRPYVTEDPTRFFSLEMFNLGLDTDQPMGNRTSFGLTSFARRRLDELATQLAR